jgi:hypothetical protein
MCVSSAFRHPRFATNLINARPVLAATTNSRIDSDDLGKENRLADDPALLPPFPNAILRPRSSAMIKMSRHRCIAH